MGHRHGTHAYAPSTYHLQCPACFFTWTTCTHCMPCQIRPLLQLSLLQWILGCSCRRTVACVSRAHFRVQSEHPERFIPDHQTEATPLPISRPGEKSEKLRGDQGGPGSGEGRGRGEEGVLSLSWFFVARSLLSGRLQVLLCPPKRKSLDWWKEKCLRLLHGPTTTSPAAAASSSTFALTCTSRY